MTENKKGTIEEELNQQKEDLFFKQLMYSYMEEEGKDLMKEAEEARKDPEFQPSKELDRKVYKAIDKGLKKRALARNPRLRYRRFAKVAAVVLVCLVAASATIFSVDAFRINIFNFFSNVQPQYTQISLGDYYKPDYSGYEELKGNYAPMKILKNFNIDKFSNRANYIMINYVNNVGDTILFKQLNKELTPQLDTENIDQQYNKKIQTCEDGQIIVKGNVTTIVWYNDTNIFQLNGLNVDVDRLINIAESVEFVN